jgi:formiminotetrahydrofolate cyclodeaminase
MSFDNDTIKAFIEKVGESSPTPGGGSAAAFVGSLASALSEMVCNLTIGKEKYTNVETEIIEERRKCRTYMKKLMVLMDTDAEAFDEVMKAFRIPRDQKGRSDAISTAYKNAASVPLTTAEYCIKVMESAVRIAEKGNKNSITDAASAVLFADAALHAAVLNVRINLSAIKDTEFVREYSQKITLLKRKASDISVKTSRIVEEYI